jgi:S1-C subfamily serine protease
MFVGTIMIRTATIAGLMLCCAAVMAQTPAPTPQPQSTGNVTPQSSPARSSQRANEKRGARQVVTVVHRINGLKMFRFLLRSQQQVQGVSALDSTFNLMDDVHANVIAGVAMEDGETIAAWLPEMEVEFGPASLLQPGRDLKLPASPNALVDTSLDDYKEQAYGIPDVTIIGPDGKQLLAKYIGFDATTGLCIMRLTGRNLFPPAALKVERIDVGENVFLFGPEPVVRAEAMVSNNLYVRMGAIEGRIQNVMAAPSGEVARLTVSAPRLSRANIGGVAVNEAGDTIGIIDGLEGNQATILPAASIRRAAQRVLEQQASVPRPWLGVRGEAVIALNLEQILNHGWAQERAAALAGNHRGIMLTSVMPGSPAAKAELRAGDVILKVGDNEIKKAEDFTWWLEQAGPSTFVRFTVARPDRPAEEALNVKLSGLLDPGIRFDFRNRFTFNTNRRVTRGLSLLEHGIETIALRPLVATQLNTNAGLLVVYVEPGTPAAEAGLQLGDVIQSIDGKPLAALSRSVPLKAPSTLEIVRGKEKLSLKLSEAKQK